MADRVHAAALRMLARRALFVRELQARLRRKGFTAAEVEGEVERLVRVGLLDDLELARSVCRSRLRRGYGPRMIEAVLRRRLAAPEAEAEALAGLDESAVAGALAHAVRRARRRRPEADGLPEARDKMIRYLLARGFGAEEILGALGPDHGEDNDAGETFE